jgi:hypothetical protein
MQFENVVDGEHLRLDSTAYLAYDQYRDRLIRL